MASFIKDETSSLEHTNPIVFDKIVVPISGSPILGFVLAETLGYPVVLFRGNANPKIRQPCPEDMPEGFLYFNGTIKSGERAVLVDDSTTGGAMLDDCIERLREIGVEVHHSFVLFEPEGGGARDRLARKAVELHSIVKMDTEFRDRLNL